MHVTLGKHTGRLIEAHSSYPMMSFVSPEGVGYSEPYSCKDYATDAFWSENHKKDSYVYGFAYKHGTMPLDAEYYFLALNSNKPLDGYVKGLQAFMNKIEGAMGFRPSTVLTTQDEKIIVLKFPSEWTKQPFLVSALTQFARSGLSFTGGDVIDHLKTGDMVCSYDKHRMQEVANRTALLMNGNKYNQTWEEYKTANAAHSAAGFISWIGLGKPDPRFIDG